MPKFRVNLWLQLNNIGFPSIITLWLLITYDNVSRHRGKLSHHIQLHENWYPNLIEQKY